MLSFFIILKVLYPLSQPTCLGQADHILWDHWATQNKQIETVKPSRWSNSLRLLNKSRLPYRFKLLGANCDCQDCWILSNYGKINPRRL